MSQDCFKHFKTPVRDVALPSKFTFPFYYDPHPLALKAADELKDFIKSYKPWENCFGLGNNPLPMDIGKMFGVLVVQNQNREIGYIQAFSGKIIDTNVWENFVPPLFNIFEKGNIFMKGSDELTRLTSEIEALENDKEYHEAITQLENQKKRNIEILKSEKQGLKAAQKKRQDLRKIAKGKLSPDDFERLKRIHNQKSLNLKFMYREYGVYLSNKLIPLQERVDRYNNKIQALKKNRKETSSQIQQWLFEKYNFLNANGEYKNVVDIFKNTIVEVPPSGAGDCAAPKLLQYAFEKRLKPIALAEFWWGKSPSSKIRKHGYFYPSCRGKCEPILGHMLKGLDVDNNPMLINPALGKSLEFVYEDEIMAVVNKPAEFLSVPGKNITDSVQERMKEKFPNATGPLVVHRLDMSTSGLLVIAKTKEVHKLLQEQFLNRTIQKRYIAVLNGIIRDKEGYIDLPLRVDLENRPCQMVCYEHGKAARTKFEVIGTKNKQTRIYFYPITGRTHQLRVHAAHKNGLNASIVGDDLYGLKADRLHLHAESIEFIHPTSNQRMTVQVDPEF